MAADVGRLEMLLNPLSLHRPRTHLRTPSKLKATIFCSTSDTGEQNQQGSPGPVVRSSRGRTRKSLGLEEAKLTSRQPAQVSVLGPTTLKERVGDEIRPLSADRESNASTLLHNSEKKSYGGMAKDYGQKKGITSNVKDLERKSLTDWERRNKPPVEDSEGDTPVVNPTETRQQIQDMINADLARRYPSDDEDSGDEMPLYVDEDDPYWLEEPDEGWGFKVSDIFKEGFGVKNRKNYDKDSDDNDVSDIPEMDWDYEPERFSAVDVDSLNWTSAVFGDPRPLVALIYDRYGKTGRECYHLLRELEDAANRMWETKRMPPRLAKINASFEEDLVGAIGIKEIPTLLFVKGGKLIHYQSGYLTADDLLRIISYFYHGAARPKCLKVPPKEKATVKI